MAEACVICILSRFTCVRLFATLWAIARQPPLSMGFSRQEYWSGLPCPPVGDLPDPGMEPMSLASPALAGRLFTTSATWRRRRWHPTPVLLPGKSHGWRSLVGCSPWGHEESDTTERLHFSLSCIGSHRVGHDWSDLAAAAVAKHLLLLSSFLKVIIS